MSGTTGAGVGVGGKGGGGMAARQDSFMAGGRAGQGGQSNGTRSDISPGLLSFEPLLFSAMSDDQIVEAINNAGDELEKSLPNFQIDENTGLDWLDWFSNDFIA